MNEYAEYNVSIKMFVLSGSLFRTFSLSMSICLFDWLEYISRLIAET